MNCDILVVDDERDICSLIAGLMEDNGYTTRKCYSAYDATQQLADHIPDLVILDIWLDDNPQSGMQVLEHVTQYYTQTPVVVISGHGTIETAVEATKKGAYDYVEKPFKSERLMLVVERALESSRLRNENTSLRDRVGNTEISLIGTSSAMSALRSEIMRVSETESRVMITGGPGSGKELTARTIHRFSSRRLRPFIILSSVSLGTTDMESELFGREDAHGNLIKIGLLDHAHGGTLLLDDIPNMDPAIQSMLYRALIEDSFTRVNGLRSVGLNARIISTSSVNLETDLARTSLRSDLYHRLNVVPMHMPNLRDRSEDIPQLIEHFVTDISRSTGLAGRNLSPEAIAHLQTWKWEGNIRQLRNLVERLMITTPADAEIILPEHLPSVSEANETDDDFSIGKFVSMNLRHAREQFETAYLTVQMRRFDGNISKTAEFIGMERTALHRKLKNLGLDETK